MVLFAGMNNPRPNPMINRLIRIKGNEGCSVKVLNSTNERIIRPAAKILTTRGLPLSEITPDTGLAIIIAIDGAVRIIPAVEAVRFMTYSKKNGKITVAPAKAIIIVATERFA